MVPPARRFVGVCILAVTGAVLRSVPVFAHDDDDALKELRRQVEALEARLDAADAQRRDDAEKIRALEEELDRLKAEAGHGPEAPPSGTARVGVAERLNAFNPRLTVIGNGLLRVDDRKVFVEEDGDRERADDRFRLRETEIDLRAAIDPYADGVVIAALEQDASGDFEVGVEEGYAVIKDFPFLEAPPLGLQLKLGRFRSEFGRINRLHTHDLPQSTRPLVVVNFLGEEGHIVDGGSARLLLPSPIDDDSAWELTVQAFQGGDVAVAEDGKNDPGALANLRWSRTFGDTHFADVAGIFHYGKTDPQGDDSATTYALDWLYKWKPLRQGQWRSVVLGGQFFYSDRDFKAGIGDGAGGEPSRSSSPFGYFVFGQYQLNRRLFTGLRWDWTQDINDDDADRMAVHPYVSYYFSEFLRFRLAWEHRWSDLDAEDGLDTLFAEMNFVFGSHPPEPFWVNR